MDADRLFTNLSPLETHFQVLTPALQPPLAPSAARALHMPSLPASLIPTELRAKAVAYSTLFSMHRSESTQEWEPRRSLLNERMRE